MRCVPHPSSCVRHLHTVGQYWVMYEHSTSDTTGRIGLAPDKVYVYYVVLHSTRGKPAGAHRIHSCPPAAGCHHFASS